MLIKLSNTFANLSEKYLPSPFVITLFLTAIVLVVASVGQESTFIDNVSFWHKGFWELLAFTMQMSLILTLGYALASTQLFRVMISKLVHKFKSFDNSVFLISFVAMLASFINWGLGLVLGAILARKYAEHCLENNIKINYPLVGAAAYSGLIIWHGGFSGSAPLTVATENHFLADVTGVIPVTSTIFSLKNLGVTLSLLIIIPLFLRLLSQRVKTKDFTLDLADSAYSEIENIRPKNFNDKLDHSRLLCKGLGILILLYLLYEGMLNARSLSFVNLNYINLLLLSFGLILHKSLNDYSNTIEIAVKSAAGIILLFPFYAGIMGIMKYSGLTASISEFIASTATNQTFPLYTFISSALVNLFVPSGGGQWAVQGQILIEAGQQLNVPVQTTILAFSYGDEITNMLQPFWALPLLGITQLKAKEILPYSLMVMIISIPLFLIGLYM